MTCGRPDCGNVSSSLPCDGGSNERRRTRRATSRISRRSSGCVATPYRVEEGTERLRSPTECDPEGRQRGDVLRTMRALRESVATHSFDHDGKRLEDDAKQSHSALVHRETTGRDRTPILSTRTREHDDAGHATAESFLGMLDVHCKIRAQLGRVRRALSGPEELRGCRREHGCHWGGRDPMPLNVQGQLKYEDQVACLHFFIFNWMGPECQPTKSVPRQIRLAIGRNMVEPGSKTPARNTRRKPVCGDDTTIARSRTVRRDLRLD